MAEEIICLGCPNGCHLECTRKADGEVAVAGSDCERGEDYGREEMTDPKRMVTAVVRTRSSDVPYAPIKTSAPLGKGLIRPLLRQLYTLELPVPLGMGEVVIADFEGSGVDVVVTRPVAE